MASRVNVRFVVLLSAGLVVVAGGVALVAYNVMSRSADDQIRMGDQAMDEGDYRRAREFYGRAVFRDRTNLEYLAKWRDAMVQVIPESQVRYQEAYNEYFNALRQMSIVSRTNVDAHRAYLQELYERLRRSPFSQGGYAELISETDLLLANFADEPGPHDILRRYPVFAYTRMAMEGVTMTDENRDRLLRDAELALAADPSDSDVAVAMALYRTVRVESARLRGDTDAVRTREQEAIEAVRAAAAGAPEDPIAQSVALNQELSRARAEAVAGRRGADRVRALEEVGRSFVPRVEAIVDLLARQDPETLNPESYRRVALLERVVREDGTAPLTTDAVSRLLDRDPNNADLLLFRAEQETLQREFETALATLERVTQLPSPPVSLEGMLLYSQRTAARLRQGELAIRWWNETNTPEERESILTRAKAYRAAVGSDLSEDNPAVQLLDAKIALAEQDLATGHRLLSEYNRVTAESDPEALGLEGQVAQRRGQLGLARTRLQQASQLQPGNVGVRLMLVRVLSQLGDNDAALAAAEAAREIAPTDPRVLELLDGVRTMIGERRADDPVTQALLEAQRAVQGTAVEPGSVTDAIDILEAAASEHGQDTRLIAQIWRLRMSRNERDLAVEALDRALAAQPDNQDLRRLRETTMTADPVQAALDQIAAAELSALERAINLYSVYAQAGRADEARQALADARDAGPEDPRVIELSFVEAMTSGRTDAAQRYAEQAARLNLDQVNGLTYRARLALFEGRADAALSQLEQAVQIVSTNHRTWLLLAQTRRQLGQTGPAVNAFRRALEIRPNDLGTLLGYVRTLVDSGNERAALDVARENERYGRGSAQFNELWLRLEASVGDRAFAVTRRERQAETQPEDLGNRIELGRLYTQVGRTDDARRVLDGVRAEAGPSLALASAQADWHAAQGDLARASNSYVDYLIDVENDAEAATGYITYADFMIRRGLVREGIAILEDGRDFQGEAMGVDRYLGSWAARAGNYELAAEALGRVVTADADDDRFTVRQTLIESLIRAGRHEEASRQLSEIPARVRQGSVTIRLLQAELARNTGDRAGALRLLNSAAADFSSNPLVFVTRAQLLASEAATQQDAMSDLDTAVTLDPTNWQALRIRSGLHARMGRTNEAIADLRSAVRANPGDENLRNGLIVELLRLDRGTEAFREATDAIEADPTDVDRILRLGELFASQNLFGRSSQLFEMAWERRRQGRVLQAYVESLLRQSPPAGRRAIDVLQDANSDFPIAQSAGLLVLRGRAELARQRPQDAVRDFNAAYDLVRENPGAILAFYGALTMAYPERADRVAYLRQLEGRTRETGWPQLMRARTQVESSSSRREGVSTLRSLMGDGSNESLQRAAILLGAEGLYEAGAYAEAAEFWRAGAERFPDNWEILNNLAYTLVQHLSDPSGALPLAQRAAELSPENPSVYDTLGLAQRELGDLDEAERSLRRGLSLSSTADIAAAAIRVHLAAVRLRQGDRAEAIVLLDEAERLMEINEAARTSYKGELEALRAEIGSE
ncbi:MAG: tetratricopeptide repeat protein [Phycisphaerales bacterium]|nr:MAG: tetratricopeptide repeat protein [Phycisphaerales bacterium]